MPRTIFALVATLTLAFTTVATACGPGGCPIGACATSGANGGVYGVQGDYYFTALLNAKALQLSEAQVAQLTARYQAQRKVEASIHKRFDEARERLQSLIGSGHADEAQVQAALDQMREIKAELRASVIKSAEEGQKLLTEAQRDRLWKLVNGEPVAVATPKGDRSPES